MKALLLDATHPLLEEGLEKAGIELIRDFETSFSDFPQAYFQVDAVVIRSRMTLDASFITAFPNLKAIGRLGAGLENIDTSFAQSKGISCLRVPEGNAQAVAEHCLGMLLSLINHQPRAAMEVRKGLWRREENKGRELVSLTVGIIGYGVMGAHFAQMLAALGVKVLAHDKYKSGFSSDRIAEASLTDLYRECDVISLHLPLTEETHYFANAEFFNAFQKPIYFLNTARGPIAQTEAVVEGLETGQILGVGLDVLEYEKKSFTQLFSNEMPEPLQKLLQRDNVIITPHIAGWTHESFAKMGKDLADKLRKVLV
jgi:D-3-phosphoglycerate dehydrogenase